MGKKLSYKEFNDFLDEAIIIGLKSGNAHIPTPMYVAGYAPIPDGVCGFAQINIKANNPLGRHIAKICREQYSDKKGWSKRYNSGFMFWVPYFNQSYEKKKCMANSMTNFFLQHNYPCWASAQVD
jgi:hypothetical protein